MCVSTQAILRVAKRENSQRDLFLDPEQEYREAVQFSKHEMDWTNRFILGDSRAVMASLGVEGYVSLCPELDIASQGDTVESARYNLRKV